LGDFQGLPASGEVAADTRKMLFRYSVLCGTASDAVDALILLRRIKIGNPEGFQIIEIQNVRIP
jgi:hypothetical protein